MTREVPLVGGPGDGEWVRASRGAGLLPGIRWHGPDPDVELQARFRRDDAVVELGRPGVTARYRHLVAVRYDAHPCLHGAFMLAEWDAYVWAEVTDLRVPDGAMRISPSRFYVTTRRPRIAPDVFVGARGPYAIE